MLKELIEKLNSLKICQSNIEWWDDLPKDIYDRYFEDKNSIADGLDLEEHRWYQTAIEVYGFDGKYLGVRVVTTLFSEMSNVNDLFHPLVFFEMEKVKSVTYKKKQ